MTCKLFSSICDIELSNWLAYMKQATVTMVVMLSFYAATLLMILEESYGNNELES